MPRYSQLRTLSFRLSSLAEPVEQTYYGLKFPANWVAPLRSLQAAQTGRENDPNRIPIASLNATLRALAPDLISTGRDIGTDKGRDGYWLYSSEPVSVEALSLIIKAWANVEFAKTSEAQRRDAMMALQANQLHWEKLNLNFYTWQQDTNGTAKLDSQLYFLWPDRVAARLAQPRVELEMGKFRLRFRRVPSESGKNYAEILSWPPQERNGDFWSVCVTLSLQTVPFQPEPSLHCDVGVRRWAGGKNVRLPRGKTSVYLLASVPWVQGLKHSQSFQVARLQTIRTTQADNEARFQPVWSDSVADIVRSLQQPRSSLPEPERILQDPIQFHQGEAIAALVYSQRMQRGHKVSSGLPPKDRRDLAEHLVDELSPEWEVTPALDKVAGYKARAVTNPFGREENKQPSRSRQIELIREVTGESFTVEIYQQSSEVGDALTHTLADILGLARDSDSNWWRADGLSVQVLRQPLGARGAPLELKGFGRLNWQKAIQERCENLSQGLPGRTELVGTLVELQNNFSDFRTDPKIALRLGLAWAGRVSQFITPGSENLAQRARAAVLDLLRHLGVQPVTVPVPMRGIPADVQLIGLWMIKRNAWKSADYKALNVPVLVRFGLNQRQVWATAPGLSEWLRYPDFLQALAMGTTEGYDQPKYAVRVLRQMLERELSEPTLLLCYAQNMRGAWPWLANGALRTDRVTFGDQIEMPLEDLPGLRIVRVRGPESSETPQWYAQSGNEQGFAKGLFQMGNRVFASTYSNPPQMKTSRRISKLTDWETATGNAVGPNAAALSWNPRIYELTVAGLQPGDDPAPWAALTHVLRQAAFTYEDATALPLPLHLAKLTEEYALWEPASNDSIED